MTTQTRPNSETIVKERIGNDLKDHVVTLLHSHGLYRHWRCQNKSGTFNQRFDIVTWPGFLAYTGDMGEYLFCRTADMVAFMRGSCMSYSYAAEKCVAHDGRLQEWREELFLQALKDRQEECEDDSYTVVRRGGKVKEKVSAKISEIIQDYENYSLQSDAEKAMYESGLSDELPSCKDYTVHFLWALHAIHWFIGKLDAEEVVKP